MSERREDQIARQLRVQAMNAIAHLCGKPSTEPPLPIHVRYVPKGESGKRDPDCIHGNAWGGVVRPMRKDGKAVTTRRDFLRRTSIALAGSLIVGDAALELFERLTHQRKSFPSAGVPPICTMDGYVRYIRYHINSDMPALIEVSVDNASWRRAKVGDTFRAGPDGAGIFIGPPFNA